MKQSLQFRLTTILTLLFLSFLVGLALARSGNTLNVSWLFFTFVLFGFSLKRRTLVTVLAATLFGITAGIIRGQVFLDKLQPYEAFYGKTIKLKIQAESDAVYADGGQLEFDGTRVEILEPTAQKLPGKVQVRGLGAPIVYRGDILEVEGRLFPTGGSRQGRVNFAAVRIVGRSGSWIEKARRNFVAGMQTAVPEPHASFGLGLLIGQRSTLPDDVSDQLSIVGLTHIIAVSGYNLTIIIRGVRRKLGNRSKYQSTIISLTLMSCFLLFTGFSASIVRASIVSTLSLAAWYYGRQFKPLLLIALAAALTAGWNPIYIWSDIGWYLSFLAFFGVLVLAPRVKIRLFGKRDQKFLGQVILESISAQVMVAPLILYIFGEVSLIALLSNIIIVPLVPFAMVFSLIAGLAGMLLPILAGFFAWPATILMTYMLDVVSLFARVPHARVEQALPLSGMLVCYGLIGLYLLIVQNKLKTKYGTITDKNIIE